MTIVKYISRYWSS